MRLHALLLASGDFFISAGATYMGAYIRFRGDVASILSSVGWLLPKAVLYAAVVIICLTAIGLYQQRLKGNVFAFAVRVLIGFLFAGMLLAFIFYLCPQLSVGRGVLIIAMALSMAGIIVLRVILNAAGMEDVLKRRIIVLGAGRKANSITGLHSRNDSAGFQVVGFVPVMGEIDVVESGRILRLDQRLADYASRNQINEVVVALDDRRINFPMEELLECRMRGIPVIDELTFFERETGKVRLDMLQPSWIIFSDCFQSHVWRRFSKRLFDIVVSLLVLSVAWPIMMLTALAIVIESGGKGPVQYRQVRVGEGDRSFTLLKFRSMRVDAEKDGKPQWAQKDDVRITKVGRVIRKFRIDELPQIFNILRGEMSIVGPRPERPEFVDELGKRIAYYHERHRIKPGLSGWAQLRYPYGATEKDAIEKLQYDLYYVKNHSLFLDLSILFLTVEAVCFGKGAR